MNPIHHCNAVKPPEFPRKCPKFLRKCLKFPEHSGILKLPKMPKRHSGMIRPSLASAAASRAALQAADAADLMAKSKIVQVVSFRF